MKDFTLLSVGASFKNWGCCTFILPKTLADPHDAKKKGKKCKNSKILGPAHSLSSYEPWLAAVQAFFFIDLPYLSLPPAPNFFLMWSTHFHWF
jgi:hypothetical protein